MKPFVLIALLFVSITSVAQQVSYEVYAIEFARVKDKSPVSDIAINPTTNDSVRTSFMFWLLKGSNGKKILVDAGFHQSKTNSNIVNYVQPDVALQKVSVQPGEITDIVLTHPHWDHMSGIDLFPNAEVWMQDKDYNYFVGDSWQPNARKEGDSADVMEIVSTNIKGKLHLVNGDSLEIIPGIRVFIGSKHTYESQYVVVNTSTDKVLLASDNVWYYYNLDNLISIPSTFDAVAYVNAMKRMKTMVKYELIIPGHSSEVMERFPKVADGVVRIR